MPGSGATSGPEGSPLPEKKLDSWGEIASYFQREIRTVQRWEKDEGLPIHRHEHKKKSTVYAYTRELDEWFKQRQPEDDPEADAAFVPEADVDAPSEKENDEPIPPAIPDKPVPRRGKRIALLLAAAAILCLAVYAVHHWFQVQAMTKTKVRLVVLPFANLTGDPQQDYISAGLTDELITQLGQLDPQHLGVIASTSSKVVSGKTISEIGRILNVQYVLEGSVRSAENQVRIDVQLILVSDETHVWAHSFTQDLSDILNAESSVAESVAQRMLKSLPASPAPAPSTVRVASVTPGNINKSIDAYLQGKYSWASRKDPQSAITYFEQAIQLNPYNAQAYAGLASAITVYGQVPNDGMLPSDAKPKARDAAKHALELDPRLAEAHAVLGNVAVSYDWNLPAGEAELKTAIELNPNDPTTHQWYSYLLMIEGRYDDALAESHHVLELEPATPLFHAVRIEILCYARKYDQAIDEALSSIKVYPDFVLPYYWLGYAYREKKMYPEAIATFTRARQIGGDRPFLVMAYGHAQAVAGNAAEARKSLRLLEDLQKTKYVPDLYLAAIHVGLGEKDEAFRLLNGAYQQRVDRLIYLRVETMADPLRSDPRFQELLNKIGLR
jgi:TolB-like protein/cytochrome c-type biogenesis protein CcmH/NrfG